MWEDSKDKRQHYSLHSPAFKRLVLNSGLVLLHAPLTILYPLLSVWPFSDPIPTIIGHAGRRHEWQAHSGHYRRPLCFENWTMGRWNGAPLRAFNTLRRIISKLQLSRPQDFWSWITSEFQALHWALKDWRSISIRAGGKCCLQLLCSCLHSLQKI